MNQISDKDKQRVLEFIKTNELDYNIVDNDINKFHLLAHDGFQFFLFEFEDKKIIMSLDPNKRDNSGGPAYDAYSYAYYETLTQLLEAISHYDKSLSKCYWQCVMSDDFGYNAENYNAEWLNEFVNEGFAVEEATHYNYITYENSSYKPLLRSPFNTLHEVSPINHKSYDRIEKLYFEIHPIDTANETYLFKLLCNNESVFKEYINYIVTTKKGLKLFIETVFNDMKPYRVADADK
jgi:hypothetical protein